MELLKQDAIKSAYNDAIQAEGPALHAEIVAACPASLTRMSPVTERQTCVDNMEKSFIRGVMGIAQRVIGRKAVLVAPSPSSKKLHHSNEAYRLASSALTATFDDLRRFTGLGPDNPRVMALLRRRDELKSQLNSIERTAQSNAYHKWRDDFCHLPAPQKLKVLNRVMRRRSAAGACLSSTPIALDSYRDHFEAQFRNTFGIPQY